MEILISVRRLYINFKSLVNDFVYSFGRAALLLLVEVLLMMSTIWLETCRGIWKDITNKCIRLETRKQKHQNQTKTRLPCATATEELTKLPFFSLISGNQNMNQLQLVQQHESPGLYCLMWHAHVFVKGMQDEITPYKYVTNPQKMQQSSHICKQDWQIKIALTKKLREN